MTVTTINLILGSLTVLLSAYNLFALLRTGKQPCGKIARALGQFGYLALVMASAAMALVSVLGVDRGGFLDRANETLQLILAVDNFLNGGDPPARRRREWLKNKFAKLAPEGSS